MQARKLQCVGMVLKAWKAPRVAACLSLAFFFGATPVGAEPAAMVAGVSEQSARDGERLRILRDELKSTETLAAGLARRKTERLAGGDVTGADEAEVQRIRALSDIAGLEREIAAARPSTGTMKTTPSAATGASATKPMSSKAQPSAPWWDVYGKVGRSNPPAAVSYTQPPGAAEAPHDPRRRTE
ncbi:hypothetical protein J7E62_30085 [Variovorax paradoxus]|nr:hypothetical protein [Variovorax paradoxus]